MIRRKRRLTFSFNVRYWDSVEPENDYVNKITLLDKLLNDVCTFHHYETKKYLFEGDIIKETFYCITDKNKGVTWNDIYGIVNSVKPQVYKFL